MNQHHKLPTLQNALPSVSVSGVTAARQRRGRGGGFQTPRQQR